TTASMNEAAASADSTQNHVRTGRLLISTSSAPNRAGSIRWTTEPPSPAEFGQDAARLTIHSVLRDEQPGDLGLGLAERRTPSWALLPIASVDPACVPSAVDDQRIVRGACHHDCPDTCATLTEVRGARDLRVRS